MTTLPPRAFPPPPPVYGQQLIPGWENRVAPTGGGGGRFGDVFDFSFERYATPVLVKVFFTLVVVLCVLEYVVSVMLAFGTALTLAALGLPTGPVLGVVTVLVGWIPGFLVMLQARLGCERALATVRTAIDLRALRTGYLGPATD
ncbi:MAG: DUF4282 domain-containing protein [Actinobacteria bacterium]|nr:DUF4282 domain-containing protein [Actinomycetota bacterium]